MTDSFADSGRPSPVDPELQRRIQELIVYKGGGHNQDLVADIILNALKLLTDVEDRGDVRLIRTAVRELRYAFRLFKPYAEKRKVTIFGSARTKIGGTGVQTGGGLRTPDGRCRLDDHHGGRPGIMRAGHEGAGLENSFGASIRLPWEEGTNPIMQGDKKLITFKYFFTRKLTFVRHADAIALFPGGFGTMDEGYEALTLMQTGKTRLRPLVLINPPSSAYWRTWDKHIREHLLRGGLISPPDLNLYYITDSAEDAVKHISRFYRNYHSMRSVADKLVIRLKHAPSPSAIAALNEDFEDIITGEPICAIEPMPEEQDEVATLNLQRIAFGFNRKDYGRLRHLINVLNTL
jgi:uncharacterized protein (TIGR00730 family)